MQKQPLVSFVITTCDTQPALLRQCICSITALSLSAQEREIIMIDDGSTTSALNDIIDIADDILYIRQARQGLSAARNRGLQTATGKFVQFIDGKDSIIQVAYEHCLDIVRYHNPDIVSFKGAAEGKRVDTPFTYDGPMAGNYFMRNNTINTAAWSYIFERKMLGSLRFDESITNDDEGFTPQLFLRSERFFHTSSEACRLTTTDNTTDVVSQQGDINKMLDDTEKVLLRLQKLIVPDTDRPALNRRIAQLTMEYICNIIRQTHDRYLLNERLDTLKACGLFPLPERDYSKKYRYMRKMINNSLLRRLLFVTMK